MGAAYRFKGRCWALTERGERAISEPHDPRSRPPANGQISDIDWELRALDQRIEYRATRPGCICSPVEIEIDGRCPYHREEAW